MSPPDEGRPGGHETTETASTNASVSLSIPVIDPEADILTAALAYAAAGFYVLPVKRGSKHPGSVVGDRWQDKSSREPKQIAAWFAGTDHGIALHCGRSGAIVFDVDTPSKLPDMLAQCLVQIDDDGLLPNAPFQSTRPETPGRGHFVFTMPAGRMLGNGLGRLGGGWGEIRGSNGVVVAAPTPHPEGGRYNWICTGVAPVLPDEIAELLDDASPAEDAATDEQVAAFLAEHGQAERPEILAGWKKALVVKIEHGESCHTSTVSVLTGALKEARAGYFPAIDAIDALKPIFLNAVALGGSTGKIRKGAIAESEFAAILSWAVAQANAADLGPVRERTEKKMPSGVEEVDLGGQTSNNDGENVAGDDGTEPSDNTKKKKEPRESVAAQLVRRARARYTLGVTDTGEPFGVNADRPHIAMMLRGGRTGLRAELANGFFVDTKTVASQQALTDACNVLEGYAAQEDPQPVHLRVAGAAGSVYVDMGDIDSRVVEIHDGGWRITNSAPVLFRRTKLTGRMVEPVAGGDISRLWFFVHINEADQPLVLAWLVTALIQPNAAHAVLSLLAEQGSAKSTMTRCLVDLVDPSAVPLRKAPRDAEGWVTAANASWVVAVDNLSGTIPLWFSDCLCRASTGDGDVRRQLWTDSDVSVISFRRVVVFNGIDVMVDQGDLADRLLRVHLHRLDEDERRGDEELESLWADARPHILGGLLDLAAKVHQRLAGLTVEKLPRMADYARVLAAVDEELGTDGSTHYREQSRRLAADTLDDGFIAEIISRRYSCTDTTSAQILTKVKGYMIEDDATWRAPRGWPRNARELTAQLTRHAPAMRSQGWVVEDDGGHNKRGVMQWTIDPPTGEEKPCNPDPPTPPNPPSGNNPTSDGIQSGGDDGGSPGGPNPPSPPDPLTETPLTSDDGQAGMAGQECTSSLVAERTAAKEDCDVCGTALLAPQSISRGRCEGCVRKHGDLTQPSCDCGAPVPPPFLPGTDERIECLDCNHRYNTERLAHYADHGRPGGPKRPGMLFPGQNQGDREPTAAQREGARELLRGLSDELET